MIMATSENLCHVIDPSYAGFRWNPLYSIVYFSERCLAEYSESISAKRRRVETLEMFLEKIENRTINQREIEMLEQMIDFKSNNNSVSHQFTAFCLVDQSI